jgi:hypothetical protein
VKKFPQQLYAKIEKDGDTSFFIADDNYSALSEPNETIKVGVYELVTTVAVEQKTVIRRGA